jgi:predicted outer membrane repeat protein
MVWQVILTERFMSQRLSIRTLPITVALALSCSAAVAADVFFVPEDLPTISEAIEAASDGDIIQVGPGVFRENLSISGKRISIRGEMYLGPTIIDGSAPSNDCGSCVLVTGGSELVLDSLVLRNGTGCPVYGIRRGGGLYSEFATVELVNITIEDCSVLLDPFGSDSWGGAVCNYFGSLNLSRCTFRNNVSEGSGGAIWSSEGPLSIIDSVFTGNAAINGGAVSVDGGTVSIDFCSFRGNTALEDGGGMHVLGFPDFYLGTCDFESNVASRGAGCWLRLLDGLLVDSTFSRQIADPGEGAIRMDDLDLVGGAFVIGGSAFCGSVGGDIVGSWEEGDPNSFETNCSPIADLDGNGLVDGADLTMLLGVWGTTGGDVGADLDLDGLVDGADLTLLLGAWSN